MHINQTQRTTMLQSGLTFKIVSMRGKEGFPDTQEGMVFSHHEKRIIQCRVTGLNITRNARYVIRTDATGQGWRIDHQEGFGLDVAVYGPNLESYFKTNTAAAKGLEAHLEGIKVNSTVGQ